MAKESVITEEGFERLLLWLDRNRDAAAQKYERIRGRLIRIFTGRGCFEAEALADETFNRVSGKLPQIADSYTGEPALYFYGVADKLHLEWRRKQRKLNQFQIPAVKPDINDRESEYECLESCLKKLPAEQHRIIVNYYKEEKTDKIKNRRQMAETFGLSMTALQIKTSRIRTRLRTCLQNCLAEKN